MVVYKYIIINKVEGKNSVSLARREIAFQFK